MSEADAEKALTPEGAVDRYKVYRAEDKHECDLLSARINTLLTSQSLLATAAAILFANGKVDSTRGIAWIGVASSILAFLAIGMSCLVLRRWHEHGKSLVRKNATALDRYTYGREPPDAGHFFSIEFFGLGLAVVAATAWIVVLANSH